MARTIPADKNGQPTRFTVASLANYVLYRVGCFLTISDWHCLRCGDVPDYGSKMPYCVNCAEDLFWPPPPVRQPDGSWKQPFVKPFVKQADGSWKRAWTCGAKKP